MVEGRYKVMMNAPLGMRHGFLTIRSDADKVSGIFQILQHDNPIQNGRISGDNFSISGFMVSPVRVIPYHMVGTVTGDVLEASVTEEFGSMRLTGSRI